MPLPVPWRDTLVAVFLVSAVPVFTVAALAWDAARVRRAGPHLACVAAGALAGAALFQLVPEALAAAASRARVAALVAAGFATFAALERLLHGPRGHAAHAGAAPAGAALAGAAHARRAPLAALTLAGDALHNLLDGALLAATFLADPAVGALAAGAVALHEVPRELGSFGALVHAGVPVPRAVAYSAAMVVPALGGAAATLALGEAAAAFAQAALPFAAGTFLYIAGALLAPMARRGAVPARRLGLVALGLAATAVPALLHRH